MTEKSTKADKKEAAPEKAVTILAKIQEALKVPKDRPNEYGNFKYRSAEDIEKKLKPLLIKYHATVHFNSDIQLIGNRYYFIKIMTYEDPERTLKIKGFAREPDHVKGRDDAQVTGSSASYAKKDALGNLFLIDDSRDDPDSRDNSQLNNGNYSNNNSYNNNSNNNYNSRGQNNTNYNKKNNTSRKINFTEKQLEHYKVKINGKYFELLPIYKRAISNDPKYYQYYQWVFNETHNNNDAQAISAIGKLMIAHKQQRENNTSLNSQKSGVNSVENTNVDNQPQQSKNVTQANYETNKAPVGDPFPEHYEEPPLPPDDYLPPEQDQEYIPDDYLPPEPEKNAVHSVSNSNTGNLPKQEKNATRSNLSTNTSNTKKTAKQGNIWEELDKAAKQ